VRVDAREPERRRQQRRGRTSVGTECLTVEEELGIELPWAPTAEHSTHGGLIGFQQVGYGREIWGERDDGADVEVAIGPAIEPPADARRHGIVDSGVAQRALDADGLQPSSAVAAGRHADDGSGVERGDCHGRVIEVDTTLANRRDHGR
jgi:hypothetical protein